MTIKVKCPTCSKDVEWVDASEFRPFCSERCKMIDLGAWSNEEYTIPVTQQESWSENDTNNSATISKDDFSTLH